MFRRLLSNKVRGNEIFEWAGTFRCRHKGIERRTGPRISKIRIGHIELMGLSRLLVFLTRRSCKVIAFRNLASRGLAFDRAIRTSVPRQTAIETNWRSPLIRGLCLDRGSCGESSETLLWTARCVMTFFAARITCYICKLTRNRSGYRFAGRRCFVFKARRS